MDSQPWITPDFLQTAAQQEQDSYLSKLTAFLSAHPSGGLPQAPSLSSPEASDSSSPSSSDGVNRSVPLDPVLAGPERSNSLSATNVATFSVVTPMNDKRKPEQAVGGNKDRRASSSGSQDGTHPHPDFDDEDNGAEDGTKGKGKTSDRRRAQNRQAQRAFRERKEKHLKELEDRVFSLEQQTTEQVSENGALKQLLERLQSENERLKVFESAFSFTVDPAAMPTSATFKPPTPPVAPSDYSYNFAASQPLFSPSSAFGLPPTSSALDDFSFLNSFTAPSPASTSSSFSNTLATPPDDLFSAYRDNGPASFSELDNLFAGTDDLGAYLTSPSPPAAAVKSVEKPKEVSLPPLSSCTLGIKGETYEFDVDGLCADMKAKATCQEAARQALQAAMKEDEAHTSSLFAAKKP